MPVYRFQRVYKKLKNVVCKCKDGITTHVLRRKRNASASKSKPAKPSSSSYRPESGRRRSTSSPESSDEITLSTCASDLTNPPSYYSARTSPENLYCFSKPALIATPTALSNPNLDGSVTRTTWGDRRVYTDEERVGNKRSVEQMSKPLHFLNMEDEEYLGRKRLRRDG